MQFLYPNILWALFSLAIPLIIHFFNFRRYKTVYFSNVAFLQNIQKQVKSRSRLKNFLILFLRLLALASLVLIFAQPFIPFNKNIQVSKTPYVAVYIDNSFSMDAEGKHGLLLESAKVKAKELSTLYPRNTKYLLITNDFALLHQRFVSSDQFVDWVSQIKSTHMVRHLDEVFSKIAYLLPQSDSGTVHNVFLLSDFQRNIFQNNKQLIPNHLKINALPFINQAQFNLFIDSVWFETPGHYKGKLEKLHIKIVNISDENYSDIPLQLTINDSLKSSLSFDIKSNESKELAVSFTQWNQGYFAGKVEISDYPVTFDNRLFFNFEIQDKKSVLIINGTKTENYFEALFKEDENIRYSSIGGINIPYNSFKNFQVIILNQIQTLSTGLISEALKFANQGGTLVFIPAKDGNIENYNDLLYNFQALQILKFDEQEGSIANIDMNDELFKSALSKDQTDIIYPYFKGAFSLQIQPRSITKPLFTDQPGNPLFLQIKTGLGYAYVSAIPINSKNTDLGAHPLFVPLFYNLVLYSSSAADNFTWIKPGMHNKINVDATSDFSLSIKDVVSGMELKPKYTVSQNEIRVYPDVDLISAGNYGVYLASLFNGYFSYNFNRSESDLSYYTASEIPALFTDSISQDITIVDPFSKNLEKEILQQSQGKPMVIWFIWLAIIALLSEMLVLRYFV